MTSSNSQQATTAAARKAKADAHLLTLKRKRRKRVSRLDRREQEPPGLHLLDREQILAITGFSYPKIHAWVKEGTFPRPRMLANRNVWVSDEVKAWIAALPPSSFTGKNEPA